MLAKWPPMDPEEEKKLNAFKERAKEQVVRRSRVHNNKWRVIGVDLEGVNKQQEEMRQQRETERREQKEYEDYEAYLNDVMKKVEEVEREDRSQRNRQLREFWDEQKNPTTRKEYELQDPDYVRKNAVHEKFIGVSSAQRVGVHETKDSIKTKKKLLQQAQREMLDAQRQDQRRVQEMERRTEEIYATRVKNLDDTQKEVHRLGLLHRRETNMEMSQTNQHLNEERRERERQQRESEEYAARKEHGNVESHPVLREERTKGMMLNGKGVVRSEWKGMTPEQLAAIRQKQKEQVEEMEAIRAMERQRQKEEDAQIMHVQEVALRTIREEQERKIPENQYALSLLNEQKEAYNGRRRAQKQYDSNSRNTWWPFSNECR